MTNKKATTSEIAKLAGVSQSAVSMILNNSLQAKFSKETTRKVLAIAHELGYPVKIQNDNVSLKRSGIIAIVAPCLRNQYYSELIYSIEAEAQGMGYSVLINNAYDDEKIEDQSFEMLADVNIDGIIFLYMPRNYKKLKSVFKTTPIIFVSDKNEPTDIDAIEMSGFKSGILIGEHLLGLGHRNVAFISLSFKTAIIRMHRYEAIKQLFAENGLENRLFLYSPDPLKYAEQYNAFSSEYDIGYEYTLRALAEHPEVTAFIGGNDLQGYGILDALFDKGYRVPEDFSVCGFDNNQPSNFRRISLTSVDPFISHKGKEAFQILDRKISSRWLDEAPSVTVKIEYDPKLIVRGSTGPCPTQKTDSDK